MSKGYKGKEGPVELTGFERGQLSNAYSATTAIRALEAYAGLFDSLDGRLGKDNEATGFYVREYQDRASSELRQPDDPADERRLELMTTSFLVRRMYPKDVADALIGMTLFGKK